MENEKELSVDQEADEEIPETHETIVEVDNTELIEIVNQMHETQVYNFAIQWLIVGLLFFILFFTGLKAGRD